MKEIEMIATYNKIRSLITMQTFLLDKLFNVIGMIIFLNNENMSAQETNPRCSHHYVNIIVSCMLYTDIDVSILINNNLCVDISLAISRDKYIPYSLIIKILYYIVLH